MNAQKFAAEVIGTGWLVVPLIGGVLGGAIYRWLSEEPAGTVEGRQKA